MKKPLTLRKIVLFAILTIGICIVCGIIIVLLPSKPDESAKNPTRTAAALLESNSTQAPASADSTLEPTTTRPPTITPLPTRNIPTSTPRPTNTPQPTPTPILGLVEVGTHLVGEDIMPGIYWGLAGDDLFSSCYWQRLKDFSGELDSILANDNSVGPFYIEIKESDFSLETACELIQLEYASIKDYGGNLPAGTFIIGRDIQPGIYQGKAGTEITESCYWARLTNVTGESGSIIANDNATGNYFIQVSATDFALLTRCPVTRTSD